MLHMHDEAHVARFVCGKSISSWRKLRVQVHTCGHVVFAKKKNSSTQVRSRTKKEKKKKKTMQNKRNIRQL